VESLLFIPAMKSSQKKKSHSPGVIPPLRPQNYLFSCELKADRDYHFKVDNDENEHQLYLRTVSLGAGAKDELYIVEAEAMNCEGSPIKVTLATLKMSVQPTVSLGDFEITPPVVLRFKCGSGPVHISGQHLVAVEEDAESEEEEEEEVKLLIVSNSFTGVGCHALLQGIFPTQGSNPGLLHCRQILYHLSHQGSPK
uniref:Nucleophosmin n=1 Tax=Bos mutus grunniens TaxID=30521 RepID=A0A8B9YL87_BOSMU